MADVDIHKSGPVFDGRANMAIDDFVDAAEKEIADRGKEALIAADHRSFKHETGAYTSRIHVTMDRGSHVITDGGVVYGPWLEGTGSRNAPVTRFRGYHNAEEVAAKLQEEAVSIAEEILPRYISRME